MLTFGETLINILSGCVFVFDGTPEERKFHSNREKEKETFALKCFIVCCGHRRNVSFGRSGVSNASDRMAVAATVAVLQWWNWDIAFRGGDHNCE